MTYDTWHHVLLIMHEHDIMKFQVEFHEEIEYAGNIEPSRNNYFSLTTHTVEYFIYVYYNIFKK